MNLSSLGVNSTVYINDSLCTYCKMLWGKCRKLFLNKYIHSFWVTNGIKLKTVENGRVYAVTHRNDLEELFPVALFNNYVTHSGWVSAFFVMLRDRKQGGVWYFMKGRNITVKKYHKAFFCTIVKRLGFH